MVTQNQRSKSLPSQDRCTREAGGREEGREGGSGHSLPPVSWPPGRLEGLVWRGTSRLGVASLWAMPPSSSEVFSRGLVGQLAAHQVSSKGERLLLQGQPSGLHNHLPPGNKARPWAPKHPNTLTVRFSGAEEDGEFPLWCHKPKFRTSARCPLPDLGLHPGSLTCAPLQRDCFSQRLP